MPSFFELLEDTMLMVAANGAGAETQLGPVTFSKPPLPEKGKKISNPETFPIWHWTTGSDPTALTDVSVIARGMGNARMQVCDKIAFENIKIKPVGKPEITLSLTNHFMLRELFLDSGHIRAFDPANPKVVGSHFLYPLETQVDKSILRVFGFDFISGYSDAPVAIPPEGLLFRDFMPEPNGGKKSSASQGERITASLGIPRIVVFISLVCCKERADFEPGGILGGGRMIPHIMIMANQPLEHSSGTVHIQRPSSLTMLEGHDHDHHKTMNNNMHSGFWADQNGLLVPTPFWDDIFDCYELNVTSGTRKVVRPTMGKRILKDVVMDLFSVPVNPLVPTPTFPSAYFARDIERMERQGAFDNLHVAPTMKSDAKDPGTPYFLDRVVMAPFCEHDCLHTHWRWGSGSFAKKQNYGWSKPGSTPSVVPGAPYLVEGAPLVPDNQQVDIETLNSSTFKYHAKAIGASAASSSSPIPAGTYTFINHHGSAYSLSINALMFAGAKAAIQTAVSSFDEPPLSLTDVLDSNSAHFYWHLRFGGREGSMFTDDIVQERLLMQDASGSSTMSRIHND